MDWMIIIAGAAITTLVGMVAAGVAWLAKKVIGSFTEKIEDLKTDLKDLEEKINNKLTTNSTVHFADSKEAYADIKVLQRITKNL